MEGTLAVPANHTVTTVPFGPVTCHSKPVSMFSTWLMIMEWNMPNMLKQSFVLFQLLAGQIAPCSSFPGKFLNYSHPLGSFPIPLFLAQFKDKYG